MPAAAHALDQLPEHLPRHAAPRPVTNSASLCLPGQDGAARLGQVALQPAPRLLAEGHQPLLAALARDPQHAFGQAHLHGRRPPARSPAGRWRTSAPAWRGRAGRAAWSRRARQQRLDLRLGQVLGTRSGWRAGSRRSVGSAARQALAQRPAEEALEHRQPPVGGVARLPAWRAAM
jgi:hypothetical protein